LEKERFIGKIGTSGTVEAKGVVSDLLGRGPMKKDAIATKRSGPNRKKPAGEKGYDKVLSGREAVP